MLGHRPVPLQLLLPPHTLHCRFLYHAVGLSVSHHAHSIHPITFILLASEQSTPLVASTSPSSQCTWAASHVLHELCRPDILHTLHLMYSTHNLLGCPFSLSDAKPRNSGHARSATFHRANQHWRPYLRGVRSFQLLYHHLSLLHSVMVPNPLESPGADWWCPRMQTQCRYLQTHLFINHPFGCCPEVCILRQRRSQDQLGAVVPFDPLGDIHLDCDWDAGKRWW